jgi:transposase
MDTLERRGNKLKEPMTKPAPKEALKAAEKPPARAPQTKRYDETFRRAAVENWIKTGQPGTRIAAELGVSYPSLKEWKRRYDGDATPERDDPAAEIRALKAELARVREQRDILKKTVGIFTEPSRNATKPSNA